MNANAIVSDHSFIVGGVVPTNGEELVIRADMETINVFISGDATSSTCVFEGKGIDGKWYEVKGANLTTLDIATQTTSINQVWQFDLLAWVSFRVRVSALTVTGAKQITIMGRVVN